LSISYCISAKQDVSFFEGNAKQDVDRSYFSPHLTLRGTNESLFWPNSIDQLDIPFSCFTLARVWIYKDTPKRKQ
jgi:hypothetical protein